MEKRIVAAARIRTIVKEMNTRSDVFLAKYSAPPESSNGTPRKISTSIIEGMPSDGVSGAMSPNPNIIRERAAARNSATARMDSFILSGV